MQVYNAPMKEFAFLLETLNYDEIHKLPGYGMYDRDVVMSMLEEHAKFCIKEMLPLNQTGDQEGIDFDPKSGDIKMPKGFKELYAKYVENGLAGLPHPEELGGSNAPAMVASLLGEMSTACNKSFSMCPSLTNGLISALRHHGSDIQKEIYLPKLVSGQWSGTMCLTEPHSGTDLGLLYTKATPIEGDQSGAFTLTGTKIWITFGEHDMTENIVHLVLARLPDAPPGIRGISLFLVPKYIPNADGSLGERNSIVCGGVEHKLGIHASPTCVMNMEEAKGWLVGPPHKGMRGMFTMMNHARINVGLEGIALGDISYQTALAFCKDRRQGRSLNPERNEADAPADNILVHPDVRRMLLSIKATTEGMRALGAWTAGLLDVSHHHTDEQTRTEAEALVSLLTPIIKSFFTEQGLRNTNDAMQTIGGSGYTTDWCIEQYMRDLRIALIYEGTNHIQALDLVGRKLPQDNGALYQCFSGRVTKLIRDSKEIPEMAEFLAPLKQVSKQLNEITMELAMKGAQDREEIGAVASNYLNLFAYTALSFIWCRMARASVGKDDAFSQTKLKTARFFFHHILPETQTLIARIRDGKQHMMAFEVDEFWSAER